MDDEPMCYGIKYPGTIGYGLIMVDRPRYAKSTAREIAKAIRAGATVERVTLQAAKDGMLKYLNARKQIPVKQPPQ